MNYKYQKEGDQFVLLHEDAESGELQEIYRTEEVAIAYSGATSGDFRLAKHGKPDLVQTWFSNLGQKLRKAGEIEAFGDYMLVSSKTFDVDELNKLITTPEYVEEFVSKMNSIILDGVDKKNSD